MTCVEAVKAVLLTLTPVTTLVSGRVFSPYLPQAPNTAQLPAVLLQQVSDVQDPHLRGTSAMRMARIQIDCVAVTIAGARALEQVILGDYTNGAATGLRGFVGAISGVTFYQVLADNYFERIETEELIYQKRVSRDYRIWYSS